jgi:hypothetical protein
MSVEPREIGEAARSACPHPIALKSFLSKDRLQFWQQNKKGWQPSKARRVLAVTIVAEVTFISHSVSDHDRDLSLMQHFIGRTAPNPLAQTGVAITAHHDQVGLETPSLSD